MADTTSTFSSPKSPDATEPDGCRQSHNLITCGLALFFAEPTQNACLAYIDHGAEKLSLDGEGSKQEKCHLTVWEVWEALCTCEQDQIWLQNNQIPQFVSNANRAFSEGEEDVMRSQHKRGQIGHWQPECGNESGSVPLNIPGPSHRCLYPNHHAARITQACQQ